MARSTLAAVAIVVVGAALAARSLQVSHGQPPHRVVARVTQVYVTGVRHIHSVIVAQAPHAMVGRAGTREFEPLQCAVGDVVDGIQTGVQLTIDPHSCRPAGASIGRVPPL